MRVRAGGEEEEGRRTRARLARASGLVAAAKTSEAPGRQEEQRAALFGAIREGQRVDRDGPRLPEFNSFS